jgi:hypothetical protein
MRTDEQGKTTNRPVALAKAWGFDQRSRIVAADVEAMGLGVSRCSGVTLRIVAHPGEATTLSGGAGEHVEVDSSGQKKVVADVIVAAVDGGWD